MIARPVGIAFLTFGLAWFAVPAAARADDCSNWTPGEVASCPDYAMLKVAGFLLGSILTAAAALRSRARRAPRELTPDEREQVNRDLADMDAAERAANPPQRDDKNWRTQNSSYDPGGINMHGGAGPDG